MKKFYMMAAAALVAASAFAQDGAPLYITGAGSFNGASWDAENPAEFTYADGVYTYEGDQLTQFKISTACGDWDTFNAGALCADVTGLNGEWVDLAAGDGNIGAPYSAVDPKHGVIEVKGDLSQIRVTMTSPEDTGYKAIYLRGDMNSWGAEDAWKFTTEDGVNYTFTCAEGQEIQAGVGFKIADADWDTINYGCSEEIELDVPYTWYYNGDNAMLAEDWNGTVSFSLNGAKEPVEITFTNDAEGAVNSIAADENVAPVYYNLQGVRVANAENGLYIVVKGNKATKAIIK
jgi:hypothetical protein